MTTAFTQYFKWGIPDFNTAPWHADWDALVRSIDRTAFQVFVEGGGTLWANSTVYAVGDIVISPDDGSIWIASVAHTSVATPTTFAATRIAHPTFWTDPFEVISGGGGSVNGPVLSTDNAVARFNGVAGIAIQNSVVIIDDTGIVTGVATLDIGNPDTTLSRASAGVLAVEGVNVLTTATGQPLDSDLTALASNATNGLWARTSAGAGSARTITGTAAQITVTAGDGVSGNPTLSFPADVLIPTILTVPNTGLHLLDTNASHDLIVKPGSNITADRTLTITTGDTDMILNFTAVTDEFVLAYDVTTNTWRGVAATGGTPTIITVANEATDTTCFPAFFTAATGDLGPKTNANLTYNSNTGAFSIGTAAVFTAGTIELGAAADTTLARVSAGIVSIEGSNILTALTGQPLDADLTALAANATDGFWAHTGAGTGSARTLTAPAAGLTITNPAGIAGNPTFALANDLSALEALGSTGYAVRTAADTWAQRTLTGTSAQISVSNGDGTVGNPVFSFPADILVPTVLTVPNTGLHLLDTDASHDLIIAPGSNITVDRTLTLTTGDASRTITINGNPTLDDWFDQSVKAAATPTFAGINLSNTDTTLSRVSAGDIQIEANIVYRAGGTDVALADGGTGQSLADPGADRLMGWDEDTNTVRFFALTDLLSEAAPAAGDFVIIYGAEGDVRKTNWNLLPGTGGGIASVSADPAPALGGNLNANTHSIFFNDDTGILDQNSNKVLIFQTVASAVNYIDLFDAATGTNPKFAGTGTDTDVGIDFAVKAAGKFNFIATASGPAELRVFEDLDNGSNYAGIIAPSALAANITLTLPSATGTFALTTHGTGKQAIPIPAGSLFSPASGGPSAGTAITAGQSIQAMTYDFDGTSAETVYFTWRMPEQWDEGTVTFNVSWSQLTTNATAGVVWELSAVAAGDTDSYDVAYGTVQLSTDSGGTLNTIYTSPESSAITIANTPAAGDVVMFKLRRLTTDAGDTMVQDARCHNVTLYINTAAVTD